MEDDEIKVTHEEEECGEFVERPFTNDSKVEGLSFTDEVIVEKIS